MAERLPPRYRKGAMPGDFVLLDLVDGDEIGKVEGCEGLGSALESL